jgi:hypothetical protein
MVETTFNQKFFCGVRGGSFFKKGGGTPNPFTVSLMTFFRGFISKVCRKNKVSEGISKKRSPCLERRWRLMEFIFKAFSKVSGCGKPDFHCHVRYIPGFIFQ